MPTFTIINPPAARPNQLQFDQFMGITTGLSISSMAASSDGSTGPDFIELGLSRTFNLRIQAARGTLQISLVPTLNPDEFAPIRVELVGPGEAVTAELVEKRLHHLRQLYASALIIETGREDELANVLSSNPGADIEHDLIAESEKLIVQEAVTGSLVVSFIAKSKQTLAAIKYACAIPFQEGREALLGNVKAGTALKQLEVQAKAQENQIKGALAIVDVAKKIDAIKNAETREMIRKRIFSDSAGMTAPIGFGINPYSPSPTPLTYEAEWKPVGTAKDQQQIGHKPE